MAKKTKNQSPVLETSEEEIPLETYKDDEISDLESLEIEGISEEETSEPGIGEESEEKKLTFKNKILLVLLGFFAFFVFLFLTFPTNELARSILYSVSRETGVILEAKEIEFPIFGDKQFDSLQIQTSSGLYVKIEELIWNINLFSLWNAKLNADWNGNNVKLDWGELLLFWQNIQLFTRISSLEDKPSRWVGEIELQWRDGKILDSQEYPLIGSLKDTKVKRGNLLLKIRNGKANIDKGSIESSIAKIQITGWIRILDQLPNSSLDLKICAILTEAFKAERPDIAGLSSLLPTENERICIPVRGTIGNPKFEVPNLNALGTSKKED